MPRLSPSVVFLVSGLALLLMAGIVGYDAVRFQKKATVAPGFVEKVYSYQYTLDAQTLTGYGTIIGFRAKDGKTRFFSAGVSSGQPLYARLDPVTVRYDPQHPDQARLDSWVENWLGAVVVGLLGVFCFTAGTIIWYSERAGA